MYLMFQSSTPKEIIGIDTSTLLTYCIECSYSGPDPGGGGGGLWGLQPPLLL